MIWKANERIWIRSGLYEYKIYNSLNFGELIVETKDPAAPPLRIVQLEDSPFNKIIFLHENEIPYTTLRRYKLFLAEDSTMYYRYEPLPDFKATESRPSERLIQDIFNKSNEIYLPIRKKETEDKMREEVLNKLRTCTTPEDEKKLKKILLTTLDLFENKSDDGR